MDDRRQKLIAKRRADIPKSFKKIYDKAVSGKSLRASVDSMCQRCVGYVPNEVRNCTGLACSLYAVRPYQRISQSGRQGRDTELESKNSVDRDVEQGYG